MKYLDTNILIRLITNDVPSLAEKAMGMIEQAKKDELVLLDAVITEACFVLEFNPSYRLPRSVIYDGIYAILDNGSPLVRRGDYSTDALDLYVANPKLDYVDCLLLASAKNKPADILSFDKELLRTVK